MDKEREELDEENLCRSCVNATNAGNDEENKREGRRRRKDGKGRAGRRKITRTGVFSGDAGDARGKEELW